MPDLRSSLAALAQTFAEQVLAAVRSASLSELGGWVSGGKVERGGTTAGNPGPHRGPGRPRVVRSNAAQAPAAAPVAPKSKKPAGPLPRRTPDQVTATLDKVVAVVRQSTGMRSEEIQKKLGLDKREMPRVLAMGVAGKKLLRKGERRATVYSWNAASVGAPKPAEKKGKK